MMPREGYNRIEMMTVHGDIEPLTLGKLINRLEEIPYQHNAMMTVRFDFPSAWPRSFTSWRGAYERLALGWDQNGPGTVGDLLEHARKCLDGLQRGYKGGFYQMSVDTPIHVANWGVVGTTVLAGAIETNQEMILLTAYREGL